MPYVKRIVKAGETIEIKKYFSSRYGKKNDRPRAEKMNETPEKQIKVNENAAIEKLTWLINENFKAGDFHIVLTYDRFNKPSEEESTAILSRYLRKLRAEYRKKEKELKYITVTEYAKTRIHHHILLNKFDTNIISSLWKSGRAHLTALDDTGEYSKLAAYFIKETKQTYKSGIVSGKRWNSSRNLSKPQIIKKVVSSDSWSQNPKTIKGYYILSDSVIEDVDGFGFPYQKYTMVQIKSDKRGRESPKRINQYTDYRIRGA